MLETETYLKKYSKNDIKVKLNTKPGDAGSASKCGKQFSKEVDVTKASHPARDKDFAKTFVEYHCHLTGNFLRIST